MTDIDNAFLGWLWNTDHSLMYTLTGLGSTGRWKCFCGVEGEHVDPLAGWADHARQTGKEAMTDD